MEKRALRITDGKGFGITFSNGYTVSVQFGFGNYADNYDINHERPNADFRDLNRLAGERGSNCAECAVIAPDGEFLVLPSFIEDGYEATVSNRTEPDDVLKLMLWASNLPCPPILKGMNDEA